MAGELEAVPSALIGGGANRREGFRKVGRGPGPGVSLRECPGRGSNGAGGGPGLGGVGCVGAGGKVWRGTREGSEGWA